MWSDGRYQGEGKLFNKVGTVLCEGNFVKGFLHGYGITYYLNGNVMYEGEFLEGKIAGVGNLNKIDG